MNIYQKNFSPTLHIPPWLLNQVDPASDQVQARSVRVIPRLSRSEVFALIHLIDLCQRHWLNSPTIYLSSDDLEKCLSSHPKAFRDFLSPCRLLETLGCLLLQAESENQKQRIARPLFEDISWQVSKDGKSSFRLQPTPDSLSAIFGIHDPLLSLSGPYKQPPSMVVYRSLMNDLSGRELDWYLRMERAAQWHNSFIHYDGLCSISLDEMLTQDTVSERMPTNPSQKIRDLIKFGNKLVQHGFLDPKLGEEYVVFPYQDTSHQPSMAWKLLHPHTEISGQRIVSFYKTVAQRPECLIHLTSNLEAFISTMKSKARVETWRGFMVQLMRDLTKSDLIEINGGLTPLFLFFFDLSAQFSGQKKQVPSLFSDISKELKSIDPSWENYLKVRMFFLSQKKNIEAFYQDGGIKLFQRPLGSLDMIPDLGKITEQPNESVNREIDQPVKDVSFASNPPPDTTSIEANFKPNHLKKIAEDELNDLRNKHPEKYASLLETFLSQLDPERKELIMSIKSRFQEAHFFNQVRSSLIKFMIENPGSWKSGSKNKIKRIEFPSTNLGSPNRR